MARNSGLGQNRPVATARGRSTSVVQSRPCSLCLLAFLIGWGGFAAPSACQAQDMRVWTTVRNVLANQHNSPMLAESLTIFHAGKVYDYMENVGEVVIFEPVQHRFTILGANDVATTVSFDEVQQFLSAARLEGERYLETAATNVRARRIAPALRCQFTPELQIQAQSERLLLRNDRLAYDVATAAPPDEATCKAYLEYADWAARLNYLLHPQSLFPEPRLAVNQALRERRLLPIRVDLSAQLDGDLHLRAEHHFGWALQSIDRQFINQWERRRESSSLRWISVHEYQQLLLTKSNVAAQ